MPDTLSQAVGDIFEMRFWSAILKICTFVLLLAVNAGHSERLLALFIFSVTISVEVALVSILRALPAEELKPPKTMEVDPINEWELTTPSNLFNIVVVGRAGNGKSATGNSILGREAFFSNLSPSGVTCTSERQETILNDGRIISVIDTPGLFDFSIDSEVISEEIVKCIDLAKDGIHAILMVFSIGSRFTREEQAAVESMKSLFGDEIVNYMIIVFTGGDFLESKQKSLEDYISHCPEPLRNLIQLCNNRVIIFDNATKDMMKREGQVNKLLSLVETVISDNGGKSYSNKIFVELKEGDLLRHQKVKEAKATKGWSKEELYEVMEDNIKSHNDQLKRVTEMVEEKLNLTIERFNKQLAEEQAARLEAERLARELRKESDEEIRKLKEKLRLRLGRLSSCFLKMLSSTTILIFVLENRFKKQKKSRPKRSLNVTQLEAKRLAGKSKKESDEEIQKLKEKLNKTQLEAKNLVGKSRQSDEQIKNLKAKLNETRRQSEEFSRRVAAEQQKCAIL